MTEVREHSYGAPAWYELMTRRNELVSTFYIPLFGWDVVNWPRSYGGYFVWSKYGSSVAGTTAPVGPYSRIRPGWFVYFAADDVDAFAAEVLAAGGRVVTEAVEIPNAGRYVVVADPSGTVFGGWEAHGHPGTGVVDQQGTPCWTELHTSYLAPGTVEFYQRILRLDVISADPECVVLGNGDTPRLALRQLFGATGSWTPFFTVNSIAAADELIRRTGGDVLERFATPRGDGMLVSDVAGNTFGIASLSGRGGGDE